MHVVSPIDAADSKQSTASQSDQGEESGICIERTGSFRSEEVVSVPSVDSLNINTTYIGEFDEIIGECTTAEGENQQLNVGLKRSYIGEVGVPLDQHVKQTGMSEKFASAKATYHATNSPSTSNTTNRSLTPFSARNKNINEEEERAQLRGRKTLRPTRTASPNTRTPVSALSEADASNADDSDSDGAFDPQTSFSLRWRLSQSIERQNRESDRNFVERLCDEVQQEFRKASDSLLELLLGHFGTLSGNIGPGRYPSGLSLPVSAAGWISASLFRDENSKAEKRLSPTSTFIASRQDRLQLVKSLLSRATHIRLIRKEWPELVSGSARRQRNRDWKRIQKIRSRERETATSSTEQYHLARRLGFYDAIIHQPTVDMRIFPQCKVLLLDQVPTEWVCNMVVVQDTLELLRVERSCLNDLGSFLVQEHIGSQSPCNPEDPLSSSNVMIPLYRKLTHVKLSSCDISDQLGLLNKVQSWPIVELSSLVHLSHLQCLNLSNNNMTSEVALTGLTKMPLLTKLDLSHNLIKSLRHIHRRFENIQTLVLSHNRLELSEGIDQLFSLKSLYLDHNCFSSLSNISGLARLPELKTVTMKGNPIVMISPLEFRVDFLDLFRERRLQMLAMRTATFLDLRNVLPTLDGELTPFSELCQLADRTFLPSEFASRVPDDDIDLVDVSRETVCLETCLGAVVPRQPAGPKRKPGRYRKPVALDVPSLFIDLNPNDSHIEHSPTTRFGLADVLESLCSPPETIVHIIEEESVEEESEESESWEEKGEEEIDIEKEVSVESADLALIEESGPEMEGAHEEPVSFGYGDLQGMTRDLDTANELTSANSTDLYMDVKAVARTEASNGNGGTKLQSGQTPILTVEPDTIEDMLVVPIVVKEQQQRHFPGLAQHTLGSDRSSNSPATPIASSISFDISQGDHMSASDSTLATPTRNEAEKYQEAEAKSKYNGPDRFSSATIQRDLELYFRTFVFPDEAKDDVVTEKLSEWQNVLKKYPRIQLWPLDRLLRETGDTLAREELRRLWKERVVACTKPAIQRLTPTISSRYGFHGELLWSDSNSAQLKPDAVAEHRDVLACLSNTSFYLIIDYDRVSLKTDAQNSKFPRPIPRSALFCDAVWPHALAWHPLANLRGINIGFGFQRLTLRFGQSSGPSRQDNVYVLLVSNKTETISLLKDLQDATHEANPQQTLVIENDDRHVLDAIGAAVSPETVGVVIHYQILGQRWRRGDRGTVRRVCVITDTKLFLLDEDFVGDGSAATVTATPRICTTPGETIYRHVDTAPLAQVIDVQANPEGDPNAVTIVVRPPSSFQNNRNWRLVCRDRHGAERLVEDVRRALTLD